ncbi:Y-family DNA polymerase [Mucilaginibacter sp. FT3.2]|uniref:Y-family DNA polymerase n=1 Tax=Mucilaginibacter sp. FT3.2 TaxID=2723090 RepID=UPI001611FB5A|nr:DNA polymerase Y family protein [Mucilaginibacter sp. FT3.2]MBB6231915.1 protein ImuB [Mucilaginibacter sp. FT3.2]
MQKRFITIWFRHLTTDWLTLRRPALKNMPLVFAALVHGRMIITATNAAAEAEGITAGTAVADAKAITPGLQVFDEVPGRAAKLLKGLGEWCIRYTPFVAIDLPDGLMMDISGCPHLWGGERAYLKEIVTRLRGKGYDVRAAMADTIGTAWAISRFGKITPIIESGGQVIALLPLPPAALRLAPPTLARLQKLGLYQVQSFINMPRPVLRRRFGDEFLLRLGQALGHENEMIQPLRPIAPYEERLPCLEPISTKTGIEIAIKCLLETLCKRLRDEGKGLRSAILKCYCIDGRLEKAEVGTNRATYNTSHLFKLFELKIDTIEPSLGIELFTLEAPKVEEIEPLQEALWAGKPSLDNLGVAELLDRLAGKVGADTIHRYLPDEHHWPERSIKPSSSLHEQPAIAWGVSKPRPTQLLARPELIEVSAPVPDYPPMLFRYKGRVHHIKKSDGPERIEREWWLESGQHRDYYNVEDEDGQRYWLFRLGHYAGGQSDQWFIHGFFA